MKMPTNKNIDETLEYVFKRTQNLNEAWISENVGFNMLPTVETRSTSCGDIIEILNQNNSQKNLFYSLLWVRVSNKLHLKSIMKYQF